MPSYFNLKFASEAEAVAVLFRDGKPVHGDTDIIGTIYHPLATFADDGTVMTDAVARPGWHVNIAVYGELAEVLAPFVIAPPKWPKRVFVTDEDEG